MARVRLLVAFVALIVMMFMISQLWVHTRISIRSHVNGLRHPVPAVAANITANIWERAAADPRACDDNALLPTLRGVASAYNGAWCIPDPCNEGGWGLQASGCWARIPVWAKDACGKSGVKALHASRLGVDCMSGAVARRIRPTARPSAIFRQYVKKTMYRPILYVCMCAGRYTDSDWKPIRDHHKTFAETHNYMFLDGAPYIKDISMAMFKTPEEQSGAQNVMYARIPTLISIMEGRNIVKPLRRPKWIYYSDCDTAYTNKSISIESIIASTASTKRLIVSTEQDTSAGYSINSGHMIVRNCKWSLLFFRNLWEMWSLSWRQPQTWEIVMNQWKHSKLPYMYEQSLMNALIAGATPSHPMAWHTMSRMLETNMKKEVEVLPHSVMNSNAWTWKKGDFLVHVTGGCMTAEDWKCIKNSNDHNLAQYWAAMNSKRDVLLDVVRHGRFTNLAMRCDDFVLKKNHTQCCTDCSRKAPICAPSP